MEETSKFRMTEAGCHYVDILKTITHTCSAAKVELKDYLMFIFKNRDLIEAIPKALTPYAYALKQDEIQAPE
jgi:hypothetical protein